MGAAEGDVETLNPAHPEKDGALNFQEMGRGDFIGNMKDFWISVAAHEAPNTKLTTSEDYKGTLCFAPILSYADNHFRVTERGSTFFIEFIGGMTTFFAMCYIMVLNGIIIGGAWPVGTGLSVNAVFFATTLTAGLFTLVMGAFVNIPVALAPGMGLNGYFATVAKSCFANPTGDINGVVCPGWGESSLPWSDAMGSIFLSGWIYILLTITGLRSMLFKALPPSFRAAITVGIGFFITIIGLEIGKIIRVTLANWALAYHVYPQGDCDTYGCNKAVDLDFSYYNLGMVRFDYHPEARIAVLGLAIATGLYTIKFKASIITAIVISTIVGIDYVRCKSMDVGNRCVTNLSIFAAPGPKYIVDTSDIPSGKLTFKYASSSIFWECCFTFLFVEMLDSFGTLCGIMERCGFMKGDPERAMNRVNRAMCVDGCSLWIGGLIGANSCTCFVESQTGVEAGARTGVASLITGSCFLLSLLFMAPFVATIPDAATTCALVMVGILSLATITECNFDDFVDQITAFLTIATMGFTYSITNGIFTGCIFYCWNTTAKIVFMHVKKLVKPKQYEAEGCTIPHFPHPIMYAIGIMGIVRYVYFGDFVIHNHLYIAPEY